MKQVNLRELYPDTYEDDVYVMVNDEVHPAMTPAKAMRLIADIRTKEGVK